MHLETLNIAAADKNFYCRMTDRYAPPTQYMYDREPMLTLLQLITTFPSTWAPIFTTWLLTMATISQLVTSTRLLICTKLGGSVKIFDHGLILNFRS